MGNTQKVQSVDRVFDILEALSSSRTGMTVTELSKKLTLSPSTTHRLLSVLINRNYVEKVGGTKIYAVGLGFVSLISNRLASLELKTEADQVLRWLAQELNQVVFLGVRDGLDVMYLDKKDNRNLEAFCSIGFKLPLHCTSLGKALLMQDSPSEIRRMYEGKELPALTPYSITDVAVLVDAVDASRRRGYAVDDEENKMRIVCVAAPVYDYSGKIIAAVSSSWGKDRMDLMGINSLGVLQAARLISQRMGYIEDSKAEVPSRSVEAISR